MNTATFTHARDQFVHACQTVELPDSADELEQMLRTSEIVRYELDGLADRIRAAQKVNGTPRPGPVKPMPQPKNDPPPPPDDPPPPPPDQGGD